MTVVSPELLRRNPLPPLEGRSDKEGRGRVLLVAGGSEVPGAAVLAGEASLRAGAGKLQMAATAKIAGPLAFAVPEGRVIVVPGEDEAGPAAAGAIGPLMEGCDALAIGPGMLDEDGAGALLEALAGVDCAAPVLADAAAVTGLAGREVRGLAGRLVLTPHCGEMARLLGLDKAAVEAEPGRLAREVAQARGAVVALKGATTWIADPDGGLWMQPDAAIGLGTCGSGDVLAGIVAGLLARGAGPLTATLWGVWLHGRAGQMASEAVGPLGFLARELIPFVPRAMGEV